MTVELVTGDCRTIMPARGPFDVIIADPPYGVTTLRWDRHVQGWEEAAHAGLPRNGSLWVFGSMRFFLATAPRFRAAGLRYAQEIVWRKANGTGMAADRFKRVHELVVQFYRRDAKWREVYNDVQRVPARVRSNSVRITRPNRVGHGGAIAALDYHDDGTRIMKSVIEARSPRDGFHPTQKPVSLLEILIRASSPRGGRVGDYFAGSGAAGEAAKRNGRAYVGCEIDPAMAEKARRRLAAVPPQQVQSRRS
jgi:site-specific DNA-methyltransferase (adenine-specific)